VLCFLPGLDLDHLATVTDPLGHTTTRTYDAVSRLVTQTDPLGRLTWYTDDLVHRLGPIATLLQGLTRFTYEERESPDRPERPRADGTVVRPCPGS
jgi:YD repeat-containing protein